MTVTPTPIADLLVITPQIFADDRGYFFESYNKKKYEEAGIPSTFVQDNQSLSQKGVLRGLHFQLPPYAQAKLVSVVKGAVLDVAVDIRKNSATYGQHFSIILSEENKCQLFIPEGFAHGFVTLEDNTIFTYKCSNFYHKPSEQSIIYNDPNLAIDWQIAHPILSQKDEEGILFKHFTTPF